MDSLYLHKIRAILYHIVRIARIYYLLLVLSGLRQCSGRLGDHGSRFSQKLRSVSSRCLGISVRRYSKYSYGFRLFAFAVSAMLYMMVLDFASTMVSIITQFFFPMQSGRLLWGVGIGFSATLQRVQMQAQLYIQWLKWQRRTT